MLEGAPGADKAAHHPDVLEVLQNSNYLEPGRFRMWVLLDVHTQAPHDPDGGEIVIFCGGDNSFQVQVLESIIDQGLGSFVCIATLSMRRGDGIEQAHLWGGRSGVNGQNSLVGCGGLFGRRMTRVITPWG